MLETFATIAPFAAIGMVVIVAAIWAMLETRRGREKRAAERAHWLEVGTPLDAATVDLRMEPASHEVRGSPSPESG
jgi:hypothetical protein